VNSSDILKARNTLGAAESKLNGICPAFDKAVDAHLGRLNKVLDAHMERFSTFGMSAILLPSCELVDIYPVNGKCNG
jgi:hypothetical protein